MIVSEMFRLLLGLCSGDIRKWIRRGFNFVFKKDALAPKLHEASLLQPGLRAIAAFLTSGVFSQSELSLILLSMPLKLVVSLLIRWRWWLLLGHYSKFPFRCMCPVTTVESQSPLGTKDCRGLVKQAAYSELVALLTRYCVQKWPAVNCKCSCRLSCSPAQVVRNLSLDVPSVWSTWALLAVPMSLLAVNLTGDFEK